jgi:multidrug efflux pump subunit AcrA (membrane-fusion protein)
LNAVTKAFIVLHVLFSIVFTMMVIQFSATVPDYRGRAETCAGELRNAQANAGHLASAKLAEVTKAAADRQLWSQARSTFENEIAELRREIEQRQARIVELETGSSSKDATVKMLTAELKVAQESAQLARSQRQDLEERNIMIEKRSIDLNESLNERIASIIVLEQQTRQQEQAVNLLKQERDNLMKKMNLRASGLDTSTVTLATDKVRAVSPSTVAPIRGRITESGRQFASVSVGSSDGVENGMIFIIYNQNGYLGDLTITDVRPNEAAGSLKNVNGVIGVGDLVTDENGYLAMN